MSSFSSLSITLPLAFIPAYVYLNTQDINLQVVFEIHKIIPRATWLNHLCI